MKFNFWKKWYYWVWVVIEIVYGYFIMDIMFFAEFIGLVLGAIVKIFILYHIVYLIYLGFRKLFKRKK